MEIKTKLVHEGIKPVQDEGRVFYEYETRSEGVDNTGKEYAFNHVTLLDSDFNKYAGAVKIGSKIRKNTKVGLPLSSQNLEADEIGLWKITKPKEKSRYRALILRQQAQQSFTSTGEKTNTPATWISRH